MDPPRQPASEGLEPADFPSSIVGPTGIPRRHLISFLAINAIISDSSHAGNLDGLSLIDLANSRSTAIAEIFQKTGPSLDRNDHTMAFDREVNQDNQDSVVSCTYKCHCQGSYCQTVTLESKTFKTNKA